MKRRKPIARWISACRRKTCRTRAGRIAQRGGGGAVAAPMRRRGRRPIEAPGSAAPNRSGDGAPASPHRRLGSRAYSSGGAATAPPPPRCAIWPARVRHVVRRHAEIKQAMGFRRFIFRGVTKVRDEWDPPAPAAGARRRRGLARRPRAANPRSVTAQHGSGGAVGAPMRRRTGRSLPDPCPAAPNRSGDGAPRSRARQCRLCAYSNGFPRLNWRPRAA